MKNKGLFRLLTSLLAVVMCTTAFLYIENHAIVAWFKRA